jgi:hypothetical protein
MKKKYGKNAIQRAGGMKSRGDSDSSIPKG